MVALLFAWLVVTAMDVFDRVRCWQMKVFFAWYDFWVGCYWDRRMRVFYVCLLPMVVIRVSWLNLGPRKMTHQPRLAGVTDCNQ